MKKKLIILGISLLVGIGFFLFLWAFVLEPNRLVVNEKTIYLDNWDKELNGLRVAVLTDLHVGSHHIGLKKVSKIVSLTNKQQPDVIFFLGDFVYVSVLGKKFSEPILISNILSGLKAPMGIVSILGNHDWEHDGVNVGKAMQASGMRVLENNSVKIGQGVKSFWVAGLADLWTCEPDIEKALSSIHDDSPIIMLSHNPDVFPKIPNRVSLTLAGHTHGGQVNIPLLGRPIVPSKYGQRYAAGIIKEDGKSLIVGTGIGTTILPVRFRVTPEILVITIFQKDAT